MQPTLRRFRHRRKRKGLSLAAKPLMKRVARGGMSAFATYRRCLPQRQYSILSVPG